MSKFLVSITVKNGVQILLLYQQFGSEIFDLHPLSRLHSINIPTPAPIFTALTHQNK